MTQPTPKQDSFLEAKLAEIDREYPNATIIFDDQNERYGSVELKEIIVSTLRQFAEEVRLDKKNNLHYGIYVIQDSDPKKQERLAQNYENMREQGYNQAKADLDRNLSSLLGKE